MKRIRIIDTTLRDGMHAVSHAFMPLEMASIAAALDQAGADTIEVSHGDGLGGSTFQYGFCAAPEEEYLAAVGKSITNAKMAILLIPGIGVKEDLHMASHYGVKVARIATHVTEADVGCQHIQLAKKMGMEAIGFLMMTHMASPETILEQAKLFEGYGADAIYCADSAGAMVPSQVEQRISMLKHHIKLPIGFHAHNNLGLAIGNSLAAIQCGAEYIDATLKGLGAGAGNAPHEVLSTVLKKLNYETNEDIFALMDAADDIVEPLMRRPIMIDKDSLSIGYAGTYGSFLLHARRAAEKFGVDARDILLELGRLKTVGGQEDLIVEVAYRLAKIKGVVS